jgi:MFS transporter, MHS family, shikimate and dehydroshikimate transport protein
VLKPHLGGTWVAELFAARLRYSGASLGFQIGAALSGGLTPVIASAFLLWTGATWPISLYLVAVAIVTLTAAIAAPETSRKPLS